MDDIVGSSGSVTEIAWRGGKAGWTQFGTMCMDSPTTEVVCLILIGYWSFPLVTLPLVATHAAGKVDHVSNAIHLCLLGWRPFPPTSVAACLPCRCWQTFFFFFSSHLSALEMVGYVLYTIPACPITKAFSCWGLLIVVYFLTIASKCCALRLVCLIFKGGGKANRCSLWISAGSGAVKEQGVRDTAEKSCANEAAVCPGSLYICRQSFILFLIVRFVSCAIFFFLAVGFIFSVVELCTAIGEWRWRGFCLAQPCFAGSMVLGNGFPCLYSLFYFFFFPPTWGI